MAKQKTVWAPDPAVDKKANVYRAPATVKVTDDDDNKYDLPWTKVKLNASVKDPAEALRLLNLKGSRAIKVIVKGANAAYRTAARKTFGTIQDIAEAKNITFDEARAKFEKM